jgi:hypothetical protein
LLSAIIASSLHAGLVTLSIAISQTIRAAAVAGGIVVAVILFAMVCQR